MKTLRSLLAVTAITLALGVAAALRAGPPPQFANRQPAVAKPAAAAKCDPAVCTSCQGCGGCAARTASKANA